MTSNRSLTSLPFRRLDSEVEDVVEEGISTPEIPNLGRTSVEEAVEEEVSEADQEVVEDALTRVPLRETPDRTLRPKMWIVTDAGTAEK